MNDLDLFSQPLARAALAFFDLETTGLDRLAGHRLCEIGVVREQAGREQARFSSLVNPETALDPGAAAVNGLNDDQLAAAPPFAALAAPLAPLFAGALPIAHNAPFDVAFLSDELRRCGTPWQLAPALDTLGLARRLLRRGSYSLAALCRDFQIGLPDHRALNDALALREVFAHLRPLIQAQGLVTIGDVLRYERGLLPGEPEPNAPEPLAKALASGTTITIVYRSRSHPEALTREIRPLQLARESSGLFIRAYCLLRRDFRAFALAKIERYLEI